MTPGTATITTDILYIMCVDSMLAVLRLLFRLNVGHCSSYKLPDGMHVAAFSR